MHELSSASEENVTDMKWLQLQPHNKMYLRSSKSQMMVEPVSLTKS